MHVYIYIKIRIDLKLSKNVDHKLSEKTSQTCTEHILIRKSYFFFLTIVVKGVRGDGPELGYAYTCAHEFIIMYSYNPRTAIRSDGQWKRSYNLFEDDKYIHEVFIIEIIIYSHVCARNKFANIWLYNARRSAEYHLCKKSRNARISKATGFWRRDARGRCGEAVTLPRRWVRREVNARRFRSARGARSGKWVRTPGQRPRCRRHCVEGSSGSPHQTVLCLLRHRGRRRRSKYSRVPPVRRQPAYGGTEPGSAGPGV